MKNIDKNILRHEILRQMEEYSLATDEDVYRAIDQVILREGHTQYGTLTEKKDLRQQLFDAIRGFDVLENYLRDDSVTEIMVVGASKIFIEQNGQLKKTDTIFSDNEEVYRLIDQMIAPLNRMVNESMPIVDGRLPDGSRVHVVIPPVSLEGPVITIRKFQKGGMTMERLMNYGEFPPRLADVLACLVRGRYSILISGATNSGKSSLLNALAEYIEPDERIITIEDSAELHLAHVDNLVRLETRNANTEGMNEITMKDLIKASLRMRPSRIIVGEVRGEEAVSMLQALSTGHRGSFSSIHGNSCRDALRRLETMVSRIIVGEVRGEEAVSMLQALSTGHRGSFSSIHGNSCRDALRRLETMVMMGMDIPLLAVQGLIGSSVDILIHLRRLPSGKRKIVEIYELLDFHEQDYRLNPLFLYQEKEQVEGKLEVCKPLIQVEALEHYGQRDKYQEAMEGWYAQKK